MLARAGTNCTLIPQELLPVRPVSCCSMVVEAIGGRCQPFRLTGIYIPPPPTTRMTRERIAPLVAENSFGEWKGQKLGHMICGDLNPPSWRETFEEWLSEAGILELSDPQVPTFSSGNALDRILMLPGDTVWEAIMPFPRSTLSIEGSGGYVEEYFFPALV